MTRPRVLCLLKAYPQLSETYIETEVSALARRFDVRVATVRRPDSPGEGSARHRRWRSGFGLRLWARAWRPRVLHAHWMNQVPRLHRLAEALGTPYTVRTHSFDVLDAPPDELARAAPLLNDDLCLGVLGFPFVRPLLERAGVRGDKIRDCFPVVDVARFLDRRPNGDGVMNVGACLPKNAMEDYLDLAGAVPGSRFRLYAIGYESAAIRARNAALGSPVEIVPALPHRAMPAEYKRHRWLVYTARRDPATVGWPCAVAEAQASGVGVCVPDLRPEMRDYVGDAGFVYRSLAEAAAIVREPFPDAMRERGFAVAGRADVAGHVRTLAELWRPALGDHAGAPAAALEAAP